MGVRNCCDLFSVTLGLSTLSFPLSSILLPLVYLKTRSSNSKIISHHNPLLLDVCGVRTFLWWAGLTASSGSFYRDHPDLGKVSTS